jgi:hypothetical protein
LTIVRPSLDASKVNFLSAQIWSASASGKPDDSSRRENNPRCGLWLDQLPLGISRKRMSVLAMVP